MKILAIANQKGGVGKSMLAVHLTWLALEQGQPVLLVDLDGQANSSHTFVDEFSGLTASMLFTIEPGSLTEVPQTISEQFSLISADTAVNDVEGLDLGTIERPIAHLRNLVQPSSEKDFTCEEVSHAKLLDPEILVIIDTPQPSGGD
ncbi:ParA family protein [Candidatus Thiosymbion oneisti]|uniref:ParA family protein n=1 Tax=Candidatus Thiosymbion oneisti TaxID=589554 RepID=UPI00105D3846|nr:ParA family protein [Candidatus Thiosymbion oneisti]